MALALALRQGKPAGRRSGQEAPAASPSSGNAHPGELMAADAALRRQRPWY